MGRPVEYSDQVLTDSFQYIQSCGNEWDTKAERYKCNLPSIEGLALHLEIHRSTVYDWQKKYPEFSDIIETLLQKQAQLLINSGLEGTYNPTISKVILTKHGYTDKQEIDQSTTIKDERIDESKLTDEELRTLVALQRKSGTS